MTRILISVLIVVACLPSPAQAQAYQCKSPTGALSYQDHPCQKDAISSAINLAPAPSDAKDSRPSSSNSSSAQPSSQQNIKSGDTAYYCEQKGRTFWYEKPCEELGGKELRRGRFK